MGNRLGLTLRNKYNHTVIETVQDLDNEDTHEPCCVKKRRPFSVRQWHETSNSPMTAVVAAIKAAGNARPLTLSVSREKKSNADTAVAVIKKRKKGAGGASSSSTLLEKQAMPKNKRKLELYRPPLKRAKREGPAPPSIAFQTDEPTTCPQSWCTKAYGSKMAKTKGEGWVCRLAGSCSMEFGHGYGAQKSTCTRRKTSENTTRSRDINGERTGYNPCQLCKRFTIRGLRLVTTERHRNHLVLWSVSI